jgi:type III secretory pathway component EscT
MDAATVAYAAAFARTSAFAVTAPAIGGGSVAPIIRGALALTLAPAVAAHVQTAGAAQHDFVSASLWNAAEGAALGILAAALCWAATAAGGIIDAALTAQAMGLNPILRDQSGPVARLYAAAFGALFFQSGGMTRLCAGLAQGDAPFQPHAFAAAVALATRAALSIAAPAMAAQLLAAAIAGITSRVLPRSSGMQSASALIVAAVLLTTVSAAPLTLMRLAAVAHSAGAAQR